MSGSSRAVRACTIAALVAAAPLIASCSSGSKSQTSTASIAPPSGVVQKANVCKPVAGKDLVVLADDKQSQASDNIIPAVNKSVAKAPLTTALNDVSKALDQTTLTGLNRQTSAGQKPAAVASTFVAQKNLGAGLSGGSGTIVVGTQTFPEAVTLGNVYADVLNKAGYKASVKTIGTRDLLEPALQKGEIQVVPEYAASLTGFLADKYKVPNGASDNITKTVAALTPLAARSNIVVLDPATATDENAFAVTKATSTKYGLTKMSDVATKCGTTGITFGAGANCPQNVFCADAIKKAYGITIDLKPLDYDGNLTRGALTQGRILIGEVFSSDGDLTPANG